MSNEAINTLIGAPDQEEGKYSVLIDEGMGTI